MAWWIETETMGFGLMAWRISWMEHGEKIQKAERNGL